MLPHASSGSCELHASGELSQQNGKGTAIELEKIVEYWKKQQRNGKEMAKTWQKKEKKRHLDQVKWWKTSGKEEKE